MFLWTRRPNGRPHPTEMPTPGQRKENNLANTNPLTDKTLQQPTGDGENNAIHHQCGPDCIAAANEKKKNKNQ